MNFPFLLILCFPHAILQNSYVFHISVFLQSYVPKKTLRKLEASLVV